jgi:hypothetical protein
MDADRARPLDCATGHKEPSTLSLHLRKANECGRRSGIKLKGSSRTGHFGCDRDPGRCAEIKAKARRGYAMDRALPNSRLSQMLL